MSEKDCFKAYRMKGSAPGMSRPARRKRRGAQPCPSIGKKKKKRKPLLSKKKAESKGGKKNKSNFVRPHLGERWFLITFPPKPKTPC